MIISTLQTESPRLREGSRLFQEAGPRLAFPVGVLAKDLEGPWAGCRQPPSGCIPQHGARGKGGPGPGQSCFTHREASVCE